MGEKELVGKGSAEKKAQRFYTDTQPIILLSLFINTELVKLSRPALSYPSPVSLPAVAPETFLLLLSYKKLPRFAFYPNFTA